MCGDSGGSHDSSIGPGGTIDRSIDRSRGDDAASRRRARSRGVVMEDESFPAPSERVMGGSRAPAYADPSEKELESMGLMRGWLARDGLRVPPTMVHPACGGETRALLKFIRARKSAEKSYEMLVNTLRWRREQRVDECLREPMDEAKLRHVEKIPAYYAGFGKTGHPIYLEHTAAVPWPDILANMKDDEFLKSQVQTLEWQASVVYPEASIRAGEPITQVINVWDLKGLTMSGFTSDVRALVKKGSALAQDNYPEGLYAAYIVNAPKIFSMIWAIVKQFLDAKTVAKVHIYGSGPKMWEKLMEKLGDSTTLTYEMLNCSKEDIGVEEAKRGILPAHGATQHWIKDRLAGVESGVGTAPGTLRRESSTKNVFDVYFDAHEELPPSSIRELSPRPSVDRARRNSMEKSTPTSEKHSGKDTVEVVAPSKKKCCKCC